MQAVVVSEVNPTLLKTKKFTLSLYSTTNTPAKLFMNANGNISKLEGILTEMPSIGYTNNYAVHDGANKVGGFINKLTEDLSVPVIGKVNLMSMFTPPNKYVSSVLTDKYTQLISTGPSRISLNLSWRAFADDFSEAEAGGNITNLKKCLSFLALSCLPPREFDVREQMSELSVKFIGYDFAKNFEKFSGKEFLRNLEQVGKDEMEVLSYTVSSLGDAIGNLVSADDEKKKQQRKKDLSEKRTKADKANASAKANLSEVLDSLVGISSDFLYGNMKQRGSVTFGVTVEDVIDSKMEFCLKSWSAKMSKEFRATGENSDDMVPLYCDFRVSLESAEIPSNATLQKQLTSAPKSAPVKKAADKGKTSSGKSSKTKNEADMSDMQQSRSFSTRRRHRR